MPIVYWSNSISKYSFSLLREVTTQTSLCLVISKIFELKHTIHWPEWNYLIKRNW